MITIQNQILSATINPFGAELTSFKNLQTGFEYIWQANPEYWNRSAPILFPIIGEVKNGVYRVEGTEYAMGRHGFARDSLFTVSKQTDTEVFFTLNSSPQTKEKYPYNFRFSVGFLLNQNQLTTVFEVENTGKGSLYFSVGAHPAFNLHGNDIEKYYIEFEQTETLSRYLLKNNLVSQHTEEIMADTNVLPLNTGLFDKDAIVFKNMKSESMVLKNTDNTFGLKMDFEGFDYFGIWTKPNCQHFVCLEPWCGIADNEDFDGDLSQKEGINVLPEEKTVTKNFVLTVL